MLHDLVFKALHSAAGQIFIAKGEIDQAFAAFKIVLEGDRDNVSALLGQVFCFSLLQFLALLNIHIS